MEERVRRQKLLRVVRCHSEHLGQGYEKNEIARKCLPKEQANPSDLEVTFHSYLPSISNLD